MYKQLIESLRDPVLAFMDFNLIYANQSARLLAK